MSKASINRAINWLYSSGIIGFAGKVVDCDVLAIQKDKKVDDVCITIPIYGISKFRFE